MAGRSNLQSFIETVTPVVPSQKLPAQSSSQDPSDPCQSADGCGSLEFFNLGELWAEYYEWSAYGIGVPIRLPNGGAATQYYVPYLSGVQIYTSTQDPTSSGSDAETAGSSSSSSSAVAGGSFGNLSFEFFEEDPPRSRTPLLNKIEELAEKFPGLTAYKSTELSPASWMVVAWYPIYHIPPQNDIKELEVAFLTYHRLSSLSQDEFHKSITKDQVSSPWAVKRMTQSEENQQSFISLPPFGMATYKLHGKFWMIPGSEDEEKRNGLFSSAQSWLQQLKVQHHDFAYFSAHDF